MSTQLHEKHYVRQIPGKLEILRNMDVCSPLDPISKSCSWPGNCPLSPPCSQLILHMAHHGKGGEQVTQPGDQQLSPGHRPGLPPFHSVPKGLPICSVLPSAPFLFKAVRVLIRKAQVLLSSYWLRHPCVLYHPVSSAGTETTMCIWIPTVLEEGLVHGRPEETSAPSITSPWQFWCLAQCQA